MFSLLLVSAALLGIGPAPSSSPATHADRDSYEAALAQVGRDPDAHVRLALWCEAHGLSTERIKHLALATMIDPAHATARGLLGFVEDGGVWRRPEQVAERTKERPL